VSESKVKSQITIRTKTKSKIRSKRPLVRGFIIEAEREGRHIRHTRQMRTALECTVSAPVYPVPLKYVTLAIAS
jgi:hypothetical protein